MNSTRDDFRRITSQMTFDRMGFVRLDETQATKLAKFSLKLNAVLVWAIEDYFARGCPTDTPQSAAFGLALWNAVPESFSFKDCTCDIGRGERCPHRESWHAHLKSAAAGAVADVGLAR